MLQYLDAALVYPNETVDAFCHAVAFVCTHYSSRLVSDCFGLWFLFDWSVVRAVVDEIRPYGSV